MGSTSRFDRPISPAISDTVQSLLKSASLSGVTIINVSEEAARLHSVMPDCGMSAEEIEAEIERLGTQYSFLGLVLSRKTS